MTENTVPAGEVAARLREAAGLVREGHGRGALIDSWGRRCAVGALVRAQTGEGLTTHQRLLRDGVASAAVREMAARLLEPPGIDDQNRAYTPPGLWVTYWNDKTAADGTEVAEFMEKVAAQVEEMA